MGIFFRIFIGLIFIASGFEKAVNPYQNFLYVIQAYQLFPSGIDRLIAILFPWIELILGVFLILGLWIHLSLKGAAILFASFVAIVGQALVRKLPIDKCGCFGESISIAPQHILIFDSFMLLVVFWIMRNLSKTIGFSLDQQFSSKPPRKL